MAEKYTLSHPSGAFTISVEGANRRDVFLGRGYTPVQEGKSVEAKPGQKRRTAKKPGKPKE